MSWHEDAEYPVRDWREEVINDDTRLGYEAWVINRKMEDPSAVFSVSLASWTRLAEVIRYADQHCDGDIPEAIQRLVNEGLSHQ